MRFYSLKQVCRSTKGRTQILKPLSVWLRECAEWMRGCPLEESVLIERNARELEDAARHVERLEGCLRNCREHLYNPHMPELIEALKREIDELTG